MRGSPARRTTTSGFGSRSGMSSRTCPNVVLHYRVHAAQVSHQALEQQVVSALAAQAASRRRRAGLDEGLAGDGEIGRADLAALGVTEDAVESALAQGVSPPGRGSLGSPPAEPRRCHPGLDAGLHHLGGGATAHARALPCVPRPPPVEARPARREPRLRAPSRARTAGAARTPGATIDPAGRTLRSPLGPPPRAPESLSPGRPARPRQGGEPRYASDRHQAAGVSAPIRTTPMPDPGPGLVLHQLARASPPPHCTPEPEQSARSPRAVGERRPRRPAHRSAPAGA